MGLQKTYDSLEEIKKDYPQKPFNKIKIKAGDKFNQLTVIYRTYNNKNNQSQLICQCDCGKYIKILCGSLTRSRPTISCGHIAIEKAKEIGKNSSKDITGIKFGRLVALNPTDERSNSCIVWNCQCECGEYRKVSIHNLTNNEVIACKKCMNTMSRGEMLIEKILKENNIEYVNEKTFEDCRVSTTNRKYFFDFYLPKYNCCIEYDGIQHFYNTYGNLETTKWHDKEKNNYCITNNIILIRIPYTHYDFLQLKDLIPNTSNFIYKGEN